MKILSPSLVLFSLFTGSHAMAETSGAGAETAPPSPSADTPAAVSSSAVSSSAVSSPAAPAMPAPAAPPSPEAHSTVTASAAPSTVAAPAPAHTSVPVRPLLEQFAQQEARWRYGQGALGLAGSGVLIGTGFLPEDNTWSYTLWITGGLVALGSIGTMFVPSDLEKLAQDASTLSDEELRSRWAELARTRRLERRAGAVLGGLLSATSVVLGGLVLDRELGNFDHDPRRMVGWGLIASGALGIVENGVQWCVPSPLEVGAALAEPRPTFGLAVAPTRSGVALALTGEF